MWTYLPRFLSHQLFPPSSEGSSGTRVYRKTHPRITGMARIYGTGRIYRIYRITRGYSVIRRPCFHNFFIIRASDVPHRPISARYPRAQAPAQVPSHSANTFAPRPRIIAAAVRCCACPLAVPHRSAMRLTGCVSSGSSALMSDRRWCFLLWYCTCRRTLLPLSENCNTSTSRSSHILAANSNFSRQPRYILT